MTGEFDIMTDDDLDTCIRLISDKRRRGVIQLLRDESSGEMTIDDLTDQLYESESASVAGRLTDREKISIQLVHHHLPQLAAHDVVEIDSEGEIVQYRPDEQIEEVLDSLPSLLVDPTQR